MPVPYCHVVDVVRKFDPTLTESEIDGDSYIGNEDREQIRARIDAVSDEWDRSTGTPMRLVRVGSSGNPRTYERHDAVRQSGYSPLTVSLDNGDIVPLDSNSGDKLEVRTGRDSWEDVTDQEGDEWVLDHDTGQLKLFRLLVNRVYFEAPDERYARLTYRYGALGGARDRGGETTLDRSLAGSDSDTSISVTSAARLPADGGVMLLSSESEEEYVRVTDVDTSNDMLTVVRGIRATTVTSHAAETAVHFCPLSVRDAVAAKTARELLRYEDWVDQLVETGDGPGAADKMASWQDAWKDALSKHSSVRRL